MSFKQALKDFFDPKKKIKVPGMSENFYATQDCDGCGICAKKCPTGHIKMVNGRPDWGKPCLMCAQCGDVCPKNAIAFGSGTGDVSLSHLNSKSDTDRSENEVGQRNVPCPTHAKEV